MPFAVLNPSVHCLRLSDRIFRNGIAIYLVVIVIAILSLGAFALFTIISTERHATLIRGDEIQVRAAAESGVEFVRSVCAMSESEQVRLGGIENNPKIFAGIEVRTVSNLPQKGSFRFTVLSPNIADGKLLGIRYGLQNESAKLHLETVLQWELERPGLGRQALLALPGMYPGAADSILDWLDADAVSRLSGAELGYYRQIGAPYGPRNAIPVRLEELLLVRDVTRSLLFGTDANFSFGFSPSSPNRSEVTLQSSGSGSASAFSIPEIPVASPDMPEATPLMEDEFPLTETLVPSLPEIAAESVAASPVSSPASVSSATGNLPWMYYLTTLAAEKEVNPQGIAKYDLNESNLEFLQTQIRQTVDEQAAEFILQVRQNGSLETPIDLLTVADPTRSNPFDLKSSGGKDRFYKLLDYGTTNRDVVISGRININEAPGEVLRAIPELTDDLVSRILSRRRSLAASPQRTDLRHPVWLLAEGLVDLSQMQALWKRITAAGSVYRCQVIGFVDGQGTASRFEVVVDATVMPPRQVFFKDLTMYERGFPITILKPEAGGQSATNQVRSVGSGL